MNVAFFIVQLDNEFFDLTKVLPEAVGGAGSRCLSWCCFCLLLLFHLLEAHVAPLELVIDQKLQKLLIILDVQAEVVDMCKGPRLLLLVDHLSFLKLLLQL